MGKEIQITIGQSAKRAEEAYKRKTKKKTLKSARTKQRSLLNKKRVLDRKRKEQGLI